MIPLADLGTTLTGLGTLGAVAAVIVGVALNLRKRPSDELLAQAAARTAEDAFYKGRLSTSEAELAEETARRKAAEERASMLDSDVGRLRRAKDEAVHGLRMELLEEREAVVSLTARVAQLEGHLRAAGLDPAG